MIYVIRCTYYDVEKSEIVDLIKIGYTEDSKKENRYSAYRMHNPLSKVIYEIPEGTEQDEKNLHYKFKVYRLKDFRNKEWFFYNPEIINFFNTHTTKESLEELEEKPINKSSYKPIYCEIRFAIERLTHIRFPANTTEYDKNIYKRIKEELINLVGIRILDFSDIYEYLENDYGVSKSEIDQIKNYKVDYKNLPEESITLILEFLDNFESLPNFYYRMKSICESHLSDIELGVVLDQIPLTYKQYYEVLGKDRCKSLGYKKDRYDKYISDLKFNKESLANDVYLTFEIGKRYTRSDIKTTLQNLYKSLGYNKTPKANDLGEYFDIKEVKITVSGKQERGFEIVSKKEKEVIE